MWFIRCHVVVHFNLLALSLLLRGLQSWRCQRTRKGKQIHELAPLSLFHWVLYTEPYKWVSPGFSGLRVHMDGVSRAQGVGLGQQLLLQQLGSAWHPVLKPSCKFDYRQLIPI